MYTCNTSTETETKTKKEQEHEREHKQQHPIEFEQSELEVETEFDLPNLVTGMEPDAGSARGFKCPVDAIAALPQVKKLVETRRAQLENMLAETKAELNQVEKHTGADNKMSKKKLFFF